MLRSVIQNTPLSPSCIIVSIHYIIIVSIHYIKAWRTVWMRHTWKHQQCLTAPSALHKEWSRRKEGGSTIYWPERAARTMLHTNSRYKDQRSATGCRGKDQLLDFVCTQNKGKGKHINAILPTGEALPELPTCLQPLCWLASYKDTSAERSLGLISCLLLTKVMLTAPFVGWPCRDHRLNDPWEVSQNKRFLLRLKTRMV